MEIRLKIPKTSISSESCKLIEWYVNVGEKVCLDQPLYLIESEKDEKQDETSKKY